MKIHKLFYCLVLFIFPACIGVSTMGTQESGPEKGRNAPKVFVEATIEYSGPSEKWAGPQSFLIRVTTLHSGNAQVTLSPALEQSSGYKVPTHSSKPSSPSSPSSLLNPSKPLGVEAVREELGKLYSILITQEQAFRGCLLPVKVTLIQSDGTTVERRACRGQAGWPRVASEIANHFIEAAIN